MRKNNGYILRVAALLISVGMAAMGAVAYTHTNFVSMQRYETDQNRVEDAIRDLHEDVMHLLRDGHERNDNDS